MFNKLFEEMEKETEKSFEELDKAKEKFWRGHEERMSIINESFASIGMHLNFDFDEKHEEAKTDNIMKELDQISEDLDALLASM